MPLTTDLLARPLCSSVLRALILAPAVWLCVLGLTATHAAEKEKLPSTDEIMERYLKALGGRDALAKAMTVKAIGSIEIKAAGIKGDLTLYKARPDKMRTKTEIPGIGAVEEGTDGNIVWEADTMRGPRILDGAEKAIKIVGAQFDDANYKTFYKGIECAGIESVRDKPCYRLVFTFPETEPIENYFDCETGLLAKTVLKVKSPMGEIQAESFVDSYKKVGDLFFPASLTQLVLGVETVLKFSEYEVNVDLPKGTFDTPSDVLATLKQIQEPSASETSATAPGNPPAPAEQK